MDVYEYAMQLEKDGEKYYRDAAAGTPHKGLKKVFTMLADAEVVHFNIFKGMKEHQTVSLPDSSLLKDVKNIFVAMKEEGGLEGVNDAQIELYRKAQDIEKQTEDFYLSKAPQAEGPVEKETFLRVAAEEHKHYLLLGRIIDFVSRPEQWLEDAEFYHLEDY
jgi:rubrerythrin